MRRLSRSHLAAGAALLLSGCTEQDVQWYGYWVFMAVLLIAAAVKLWPKKR